jgi:hydroxyethylthiazole kinase-like uncharacterized protein yjeF
MKIFRSDQVRQIDEYTIKNEPVASIDLMERAAGKLFEWYAERFERSRRIMIFAGPGNNGGDGLALARMLTLNRYEPVVFYIQFSDNTSDDWKVNMKRLEKETTVPFITIKETDEFPMTNPEDVIIDAIFGSGISRPAEGLAAGIIRMINNSEATVVSIDIPSGLFAENNNQALEDNIIRADYTLSFQFPKLSFMFHENGKYTGEWTVLPIGLDFSTMSTPYNYLERKMITPLLKKRNKFDHKGIYGHGLLIGGSYGKMGAIVMGAKASLRTGIGLITCHVPSGGNNIIQGALPEAMVIQDADGYLISGIGDTGHFDAAGIGPGMGIETVSQKALNEFLKKCNKPLVIDADAINILSLNKDMTKLIPAGTILTPHPGEFERLAGKTSSSHERLQRQIEFSRNHNCIIVLKGAHTSVTAADGNVWFNSTGNPGMATAGSGDVLTGMILSLLAQGYDQVNAAITGVYLHGLAGDIAADKSGYEALIATDIISEIGSAFSKLRED